MCINLQWDIYIFVYIKKKKLLEGPLGVCFYKNLQRGVKTGINYPYTCVVTCIRLIKIPPWLTIVAENKDFCQFYLPFWVTFPRLTSKRPAENDWLLQCQLKGKINNNPCLHPLEYIFELNCLFRGLGSTYYCTFITNLTSYLLK